jgi:phosphoribosylanthranilate isomerase
MKPAIKICGLSTAESVRIALENRADMIGFIFFGRSPRNVSVEHAAVLREPAIGKSEGVAVTVDAGNALLDAIVSGMKPDWLQLHGHETPERVAEVKARYGLPVMKAFSICDASDLDGIAPFVGIADKFLLDAKAPEGSALPGGNGVSFDWRLLATLDPALDYMLSGGLNAGNIGEALALTKAPGLDVSSGVESAPGIKDIGLINGFFAAVKSARLGATQ